MLRNKAVRKFLIAVFWLAIWELAAWLVQNKILLAGPLDTLAALWELIRTGAFWHAVLFSALRVMLGFVVGAALGILFGALAYRFAFWEECISPVISVLKAVPVASFIILLLILFGSGIIGFWISLIVVLPILYYNTVKGLKSTDPKLSEAADVFRMRFPARVRAIWFPQVYPYLIGALETAVGMAMKSGIAAEVIGQPLGSLGNELYRAKIYLETDKVLAVTLTAVLLSFLLGKVLLTLLRILGKYGGVYEKNLP